MLKRRRSRSDTAAPSAKRRIPLKRIGAVITLLVLTLVLFAPNLIAISPLKQAVINWASRDLKGSASVQSVYLAWWSPVVINQLALADDAGQETLYIQSVRTTKTLFALATGDPGEIELLAPRVNLVLAGDSSNLESVLADYLNRPASGGPLPSAQLKWSDGTISISMRDSGESWSLDQVRGIAEIGQAKAPLQLHVSGHLSGGHLSGGHTSGGQDRTGGKGGTGGQGGTGPIEIQASFAGDPSEISFANGQLQVTGEATPVSLASAVFARLGIPLQLQGELTGTAQINWQDWGQQLLISSPQADLQRVVIRSPAYLGDDAIRLDSATISGQFERQPNAWVARQLVAETDLGHVTAEGVWNPNELLQALTRGTLPEQTLQAHGAIDLARLVHMLPHTLPLQPGLQLESGGLQFNLKNQNEPSGKRVELRVTSTSLVATRDRQRLQWPQPITIQASARQHGQSVSVDQLQLESGSLKIAGKGDWHRASFAVQGDLQQLAAQLRRFFNLGRFQLSGTVEGRLGWDRTNARSLHEPFQIAANLTLTEPALRSGDFAWHQPQLDIRAVANLQVHETADIALREALFTANAGRDRLRANLTEPIQNPGWHSTFPLQISLAGGIQTWLVQLSPWLPQLPIDITGRVKMEGLARCSRNAVQLQQLNTELTNLRATGSGLDWREPRLTLNADADMDLTTGAIQVHNATLISSTISASADSVEFQPSPPSRMVGKLAYRADLARLLAMFPALQTDSIQWTGQLVGDAQLQLDGQQISGSLATTATDLQAAQAISRPNAAQTQVASNGNGTRTLWRERQAQLTSQFSLTRDLDQLQVQTLDLQSNSLQLTADGTIRRLNSTPVLDLQGTWTPNEQQLNRLLGAYSADQVQLTGTKAQNFRVQGPWLAAGDSAVGDSAAADSAVADSAGSRETWLPMELQAETVLGWQAMQLAGLQIGRAHSKLSLSNSRITVQSNPIEVNGGSVHLQPTLHLRGRAPTIQIPAGRLVDQLQLTPENCRAWIQYVAPLVADATATQGRFSVATNGLRIPLENLNATRGDATIDMLGAQVGPGPLGQQLIAIANQIKSIVQGPDASPVTDQQATWINLPPQQIHAEIKHGRVFHENVQFRIGDLHLRTSGSVGWDQTVDLLAEFVIPAQWVANRPYLASLRDRPIAIPIRGSISRIQIDPSILKQLSTRLVEAAANQAIGREIGGALQQETDKLKNLLQDYLPPTAEPSSADDLINETLQRGFERLLRPDK